MAKDDEGGDGVRVQVDDEAELAMEVGPAEGPKTKEEVLIAKEECFAHGGEGSITKSVAAALFMLAVYAG